MSYFNDFKTEKTTNNLVTGPMNFKIIALNPNKEELKAILGKEIEKDPVYSGETEKGKYYMKRFYIKRVTDNKIENITFFLGEEVIASSTGKNIVMNKFGNVYPIFIDEIVYNDEMKNKENARMINFTKDLENVSYNAQYKLHKGEDHLIAFIQYYLNYNPRGKAKREFDMTKIVGNWEAFLKGDDSCLKQMIDDEREIKLIYGVSQDSKGADQNDLIADKNYMFPHWVTNIDSAVKTYKNSTDRGYKPRFTFSVDFKEYNPTECIDYVKSEWE